MIYSKFYLDTFRGFDLYLDLKTYEVTWDKHARHPHGNYLYLGSKLEDYYFSRLSHEKRARLIHENLLIYKILLQENLERYNELLYRTLEYDVLRVELESLVSKVIEIANFIGVNSHSKRLKKVLLLLETATLGDKELNFISRTLTNFHYDVIRSKRLLSKTSGLYEIEKKTVLELGLTGPIFRAAGFVFNLPETFCRSYKENNDFYDRIYLISLYAVLYVKKYLELRKRGEWYNTENINLVLNDKLTKLPLGRYVSFLELGWGLSSLIADNDGVKLHKNLTTASDRNLRVLTIFPESINLLPSVSVSYNELAKFSKIEKAFALQGFSVAL